MSFRFLHAADTHIDSPMRGLETYDGAPVDELRNAQRAAFTNLVDLALEEAVDFVLLAGDIWDGDWKDMGTGHFFVREMVRLAQAGIPVYLIAGNHDAASVITKDLPYPPNVHRFSTRHPESLEVDGLPVTIHGQGFANKAVTENLAAGYPEPIPERYNIGLLHTALAGAEGHEPYAPCTETDLVGKGYHYWALGHVHARATVCETPWIVFPGNIQGRDAGELGPRGCLLVEVDDLFGAVVEFRALDVARWEAPQVDLSEAAALKDLDTPVLAALSDAFAAAEGRLLAVRVRLTGSTELHDVLHARPGDVRERIKALALQVDPERVWIEKVRLETTPRYALDELKERGGITRLVIESLEAAEEGELSWPGDIDELLGKLPPHDVCPAIRAELEPAARRAMLDDVRAILLDALRRGGEATQ